MAAHFNLTLDTTAPAGVSISLAGGATHTAVRAITATIGTSDGDTTGYQIKVWGDVDESVNANIQQDEVDSAWIAYTTSQAVTLSTGDGAKTVNVKVRDDVHNASSGVSDSITLDTTVPVITVSGPDVPKISKIASKDTAVVSFSPDVALSAYKVKVVSTSGSTHDTGTQIPTAGGSSNVSGGSVAAAGNVSVTIKGADLESASAGDGTKIVKVFGQEASSGNWSL